MDSATISNGVSFNKFRIWLDSLTFISFLSVEIWVCRAGCKFALKQNQQARCKNQFSRHPKFGVSEPPTLTSSVPLLVCEVNSHRPPESDNVVQQEPGNSVRFVILGQEVRILFEIPVYHCPDYSLVGLGPASNCARTRAEAKYVVLYSGWCRTGLQSDG